MATVFDIADVRSLILDILSRHNWFDSKRFDEIEEQFERTGLGTSPEIFLIKGGYISDQEIASLYAEELFLPLVPNIILAGPPDNELAILLPEKLCVDKLICPMAVRDEVLDVAFVSPEEMGVVVELELLTGLRINPMIAPLTFVQARIDALYRADQQGKAIGEGGEFAGDEENQNDQDEDENILNLDAQPTPDANGRMVRMVNQILEQALRNGASDIHLEPFEDGCKFRLRIDGVLHELSRAVEVVVHHDHLPAQDPGEDGHRREAHSPGRRHRLEDRRKTDRPARQHRAHGLRREDGASNPGQGSHPTKSDRARTWTSASRTT